MEKLTGSNPPRITVRPLTLGDGTTLLVRPLERSDRAALADAVTRLSDRTRYLRFAASKPRLTEKELDRLTDVDHHGHEALLAIDPKTGRGIGVARYVRVAAEPDAVEIAATVLDEWQGRGVGTALVTQLAQRARSEGYSKLRASVLAENERSIRMLRRAGFLARPGSGTLREYELALIP
jgi:RimJ/RimL family protein N-acetyltransferase